MPKNVKKGKNSKNVTTKVIEFVEKSVEQSYAKVLKPLGNCRFMCMCYIDGKERVCKVRGSMRNRKKKYVNINDIILITLRDFDKEDDKADIIHVYPQEHIHLLLSRNEIPHDNEDYNLFDYENKKTSSVLSESEDEKVINVDDI